MYDRFFFCSACPSSDVCHDVPSVSESSRRFLLSTCPINTIYGICLLRVTVRSAFHRDLDQGLRRVHVPASASEAFPKNKTTCSQLSISTASQNTAARATNNYLKMAENGELALNKDAMCTSLFIYMLDNQECIVI